MALTYPWFLLGLLTLMIPVAIHLFELRQPQRILFTNVGFIREVKLITARQRKLKHLLVLFARLGFILFLVLMFCQPFIPAPQQNLNGGTVTVLIDTSPSMQTLGGNEESAFDHAVEQARDLINAYSASTHFQLANTSRSELTKSAYRAAVDKLSPSGQSGSLHTAFPRLAQLNRPVGQTFIFSDFQKNDFSAQLLAQLDSTQHVFLVPVAGKKTQNVYVDSLVLDDAFVRTGADLLLRIRLRNGGNTPVSACQVKLFIGNQQAAVYQAAVGANAVAITPVRVRLEDRSLQRCRIEVEDFPVTFDNSYYFTLQPAPQIRVLELAAKEPTAQRLYANEPLFAYAQSRPQTLDYRQLNAANLIFLQELPQVEASLRENLRRAVQQGETVVIVPPAGRTGRESYNQLFRELGIGAVQWEPTPTGQPELRDVAAPSTQNPFFRDVFAQQSRQAVMPKAAPVLRWSRSGTDVLRMRDGGGYLAGFPSGRGMVYLFSAPFSGGYSDFTNHALFVPVMYRLAMQSFHNDQQLAYRLNQRTVALSIDEATGKADQAFKLTKDSLTFIPVQRVQAGELRFDVPSGMRESGFYQLVGAGRTVKTLAFNFDKRESDLAHYSAQELRSLIGPNRPNVHVYEAAAGESVAAQYRAERVGTPLWHYCLWLALSFLLMEVLLLRFAGRSRERQPEPMATAA